jgi:uncharacterized RDD family membrane protein YckC
MENYKDLLQDDLSNFNVKASTGKRFANYIIDIIVFYSLAIAFGVLWALISPDSIDLLENDSASFNLLDRVISLIVYGILMGIIEGVFKGKSLGKLITGTRAVKEDGSTLDFGTAFLRGLCRAVPFNQLSALGSPCNPWHDKWTKTEVIDEKESRFNF